MFISNRDGDTTSTIQINTGSDMLTALVMIVVGAVMAGVSIYDPIKHYIWLLLGLFLVYFGYVLARRTKRLIARAKHAYNESIKR